MIFLSYEILDHIFETKVAIEQMFYVLLVIKGRDA